MKKYFIVYHKEDNDGVFSVALVLNYLIETMKIPAENITTWGANYAELENMSKEELNDIKVNYDAFMMLDLSFNDWRKMVNLYKHFKEEFYWFDHHKTSIDNSFKYEYDDATGLRGSDRSTIMLIYKYFYDPFDEQFARDMEFDNAGVELLKVLSAYDSWTHEKMGYKFDSIYCINKAVTVRYKLDIQKVAIFVKHILNNDIKSCDVRTLHDQGKVLVEYDEFRHSQIINEYGDGSWVLEIDFEGGKIYRNACALFLQEPTNSQIFKTFRNEHDVISNGIVFKKNVDDTWNISLYNVREDDFHCGEFLKKKYGGGGHQGAAGCTISNNQFLKILKNKVL